VAVLASNICGHSPMATMVARIYKGGLGQSSQRGPRVEPVVKGSRGGASEAKALLVFGRSMQAAILPTFLKFGNAKKSDICVNVRHEIGEGGGWRSKTRGICAPSRPGPKTATGSNRLT